MDKILTWIDEQIEIADKNKDAGYLLDLVEVKEWIETMFFCKALSGADSVPVEKRIPVNNDEVPF